MSTRRLNLLGGAALAVLIAPAAAHAGGALIDATSLPNAARAEYQAAIHEARAQDPATFRALRALADAMPGLDAAKRGRFAPVARSLKALGPDGFWALIAELAFDGATGAQWRTSAQVAWQSGLLEALGELGDLRAAPLLDAVVASRPADYHVMRSAVVARAWLGDAEGTAQLVALASEEGPHRTAALAGLGFTRRLEAAQALEAALVETHDVARTLAVMDALADVGNAWVWPLIVDGRKADEAAVRETATRALLGAYLRLDGDLRQKAASMMLVVVTPESERLVAAAYANATPAQSRALDALKVRLENNPLHRR